MGIFPLGTGIGDAAGPCLRAEHDQFEDSEFEDSEFEDSEFED